MTSDQDKLRQLLNLATQSEATDIHLVVGRPPIFRIHGNLTPADVPALSASDLREILFCMLNDRQKNLFNESKEVDFSYFGLQEFQFRVNAHFEKGNIAATFRITPSKIASPQELGLPPIIERLATRRKGLVIFSGTAGSGKTTTLSCLVNLINNRRKCKIVTIEDPIEYIHKSKQSLIIQREVGSDTQSFATALKYALRQDPDVVVVGEIRDLESISMAITTAETGHLVLTTVHSPDSVETINRIIDVYPVGRREQLYAQLAENILAVIGHTLVPKKDGSGRMLATEVLIGTLPIRNIIRRGALMELRGQLDNDEDLQTHTLERCLSDMVRKNVITPEIAREYAKYPDMLRFHDEPFNTSKTFVASSDLDSPLAPKPIDKSKKILIVDGNSSDRADMLKAVRQGGYELVNVVAKGKEVLTKVNAENPDVLILDLGLYDADSLDICREIKKIQQIHTKVIMITNRLQETDMQAAWRAGADDFIVKTTAYELLVKTINKLVQEESQS